MDLGKKIKHGVEEAPIVAPAFAPMPATHPNPVTVGAPERERELVPVRRNRSD